MTPDARDPSAVFDDEDELERLGRRLREKDDLLAKADARITELSRTVEDLRRYRQALLGSRSWRITAPFRALRRRSALLPKLVAILLAPRQWPHRWRQLKHIWHQRRQARLQGHGAIALTHAGRRTIGALDVEAALGRMAGEAQETAIVVPVYNAAEELEACVASVLRHTALPYRLILIDDASPDPRIGSLLRRCEGRPEIAVVRNEANLGFTRTVNRGIELAGTRDVVFLNSDTVVTPLWLTNLRLAAYSAERIATATPLSDNAGAFSAPVMGQKNERPPGLTIEDCGRLATRGSARLYPRVPTGNGFCMYVRRAALDAVGPLDAEAFPRGYGEENDFCMRAGRAGWSHVIDDATLIHHVRSASFGEEKTPLMRAGRALIDERYPEYTAAVRAFLADPAAAAARGRVAEAYAGGAGTRPRALFVISTRSGGTPQTNADLMAALEDRYEAWLLRCDSRTIELSRVAGRGQEMVERVMLDEPVAAFPHTSPDYDAIVRRMLVEYAIELVHIRHIAWHSLELPALCKALGLPVVFSFHDFYAVCPTVKLLDERLTYCAGTCTAGASDCRYDLWPEKDLPPLKHRAIHDWKRMMAGMLEHCDAFVTTSPGAREVITKVYPATAAKPFPVIEHGRDLAMAPLAADPQPGEPLRILVPGNIGVPKGSLILQAMDRLERERARASGTARRRCVFHILGNTNIAEHGDIVFHGPYDRESFPEHVRRIRPHCGMILSIWPETYCHTLTELWSCGLPVIAFDFGAVGERIRAHGGGWLIPGAGEADRAPDAVLAALDRIARGEDRDERIAEVLRWQSDPNANATTREMAGRYADLYGDVIAATQDRLPRAPVDS